MLVLGGEITQKYAKYIVFFQELYNSTSRQEIANNQYKFLQHFCMSKFSNVSCLFLIDAGNICI